MTYQSLYRRFRPSTFAEVRGQDHITVALRNAVRSDTVGHAYMFSGPRGCGKTSSARILGRALNCTNLADGEPCGECDSCLAMEAGTSMDLHELDAASNNGVDAMRDLVSRAALGTAGRNKVYILDEVHMLSSAASNALLKTLEEPPPHVTFVLATTDPQKVLPTIKSRTQHFNFELLSPHELEDYVRWVIGQAELTVDDDAIGYVVRQGRGSARDTLSALDQVVAGGGVVPREEPSAGLVSALAEQDTGAALAAVSDALGQGSDPRVLAEALVADLRDMFLLTMGVEGANVTEADREELTDQARRFGPARLTRALEQLGTALVDMRQASDPRVPLEVALVRLTARSADLSMEALAERVEALERTLAGGAIPAAPSVAAAPSGLPATAGAAPRVAAVQPSTDPAPAAQEARSAAPTSEVEAPAASEPTPAADVPPDEGVPAEPAPAAGGHKSKVEEARAMLRAKTGKEAPKAEPIAVDPADEPPPPPRRRRPTPPGAAPGADGLDPARPLVETGDTGQPSPAATPTPPTPVAPVEANQEPDSPNATPGGGPSSAGPASEAARPEPEPTAATTPPPPADAPPQAPPQAHPSPAPPPQAPPAESPAPAAETAPSGAASASGEAEQLNAVIGDVLGKLKPVTKALFVGRFQDAGGELEFHLDNPAILERAQARQGEFGDVVSATVGRPVRFKLVAGTGVEATTGRDSSGRHGRSAHDGGPAPRGGDDADDAEWADNSEFDGLVVADLEDADPPLSAAQRLLEAFPGSELIEPEGT